MNFDNIEVKVNKPYPEIVDAKDDNKIVLILKELANNVGGELNTVLQYVYQSVLADKTDENIAEIFEEIGVVEMMHLDMLMHAISDFGGMPSYDNANQKFFNTATLNYTVKLKEMLDNNIKAEEDSIDYYRRASEKVENKSLQKLFLRIIEDEQKHVEVFKCLRNNVQFLSI